MANTKPQVKIVDCTTGEEIIRDANAEEIAQMKANTIAYENAKTEAEAKATAKAALLDKLGISAEEAQLLLS